MPGIPDRDASIHVNFPELFRGGQVEHHLAEVATHLDGKPPAIVLNFEKCHWFDLMPLAHLLVLLVTKCKPTTTLHIVGPCSGVLPYMYEYVLSVRQRLEKTRDPALREALTKRIARHLTERPNLRRRRGAFLATWGFFDAIEDHHENCRWYAVRDKAISLRALKDHYGFLYGIDSDRVRPLSVVTRDEQGDTINRVNSEELIAGALKKYAALEVFRSGAATNILFFEPFENVFQHGFRTPSTHDAAVISMRIRPASKARPAPANADLQAQWLEHHAEDDVMEIVVADAGQGIMATLREELDETNIIAPTTSRQRAAWEVLRYAFAPTSTRKRPRPPGIRGLAWLKDRMIHAGGLVSVRSDGVLYEFGMFDNKLVENEAPMTASVDGDLSPIVPGVGVQLLLPLTASLGADGDRYARWTVPVAQAGFFDAERAPLTIQRVPRDLLQRGTSESWTTFLENTAALHHRNLIGLDLAQEHATRTSLELFFAEILENQYLRGRVLILNCHRHNASRLPTVQAADRFQAEGALLPLFTPTLRSFFIGATDDQERVLLQLLNAQRADYRHVDALARMNPLLFVWHDGKPTGLNFTVTTLEQAMRRSLGEELVELLDRDGHIHRGRFRLPYAPTRSTALVVEPHQLFTNHDIARRLCEHLALLVRRRYAREGRAVSDIAILTATRIGREFAARMPEAFPRSGFVFFDHHIIRPDKPRLVTSLIKQRWAIIIVDIISTGGQVERLIRTCTLAGANVLAVLSICDFSEQRGESSRHFEQEGRAIDHLTFWRSPQQLSDAQPDDQVVDTETLTLNRTSGQEDDAAMLLAELSTSEGLVYLADADAILAGHYELFGRHFEYVADVNRLISESSPVRGEVLRSCERALIRSETTPVAVVLYPDLSHTHLLMAQLQRQPRIRRALSDGRIVILEARRATRARGRRLWLTDREIEDAKRLARERYPNGYALAIIDEVASSGQTLLGLIELARSFSPLELQTYVVVNRMTHVQTRHYVEIERYDWAQASFRALIHLNVQGYSVETCPLCRERRELTRDANEAREAWFRASLHNRIQQLEVRTSPDDTNIDPDFTAPVDPAVPLAWERPPLSTHARSPLSYIVSARVAINDGVPLRDIIAAADMHHAFLVWREILREVARRHDLLQAQQAEDYVAGYLIRTIRHHNFTPRRVAAMEIIRSMRREAILPRLNEIITSGLRRIRDPEMKTELAILIKRFLDYRHGRANERFERIAAIDQLIEQAFEEGDEEPARIADIAQLRAEFAQRLVDPEKDLPRIIRHLEGHLRTERREHHQFIKVVREYVADREFDITAGVRSAIDTAVVITYVGMKLIDALASQDLLKDVALHDVAREAYEDAKRLREMALARQRRSTQYTPRDIQEKLDVLTRYLPRLQVEVAAQLVDVTRIVREAVTRLVETEKARGVHVDIEYDPEPDIGSAIMDNTLFDQIIRDLLDNIGRYAVDPQTQGVRALVAVRRPRDDDSRIELAITCTTRDPYDEQSLLRPVRQPDKRHHVYGVTRTVDERGRTDLTAPWQEVWSFRRL